MQLLQHQPAGGSWCAAVLPGQSSPAELQSAFVTEPVLPPQLLAGPPCIRSQHGEDAVRYNTRKKELCLDGMSMVHLHREAA